MFDWTDFLDLAEQLSQSNSGEAALRTAISRAYYAVYHRASLFVRDNALVAPGSRLTHRTVWGAFRAGDQPGQIEVSARGNALKRVRANADYQNPFPGDLQTFARDTIREARDVLDLIDRL